jgi:predicted metal-dependent enzyme (double-stranded beta helix superfamily)
MDTTHTGQATWTIDRLIAELSGRAIGAGFGAEQARELIADALATPGAWLDERYLQREPEQDWVLHPLYRAADRSLSMLVAVFKPGAAAPIHDHHAWAVVGVYRGSERETRFRRVDDGGRPGQAELHATETLVSSPGDVTIVPAEAIHTVEALGDHDAVSIHVYGTDIVTQARSTYDLATGTVTTYQPDFAE